MGYKGYNKSDTPDNYVAIEESDEVRRGREQIYMTYAFNDAYEAVMKVASEAFVAGLDDIAFYLRSEAEKIRERANEPWGN